MPEWENRRDISSKNTDLILDVIQITRDAFITGREADNQVKNHNVAYQVDRASTSRTQHTSIVVSDA